MKSYTDIEQSKKLAEILPVESADMHYCFNFDLAMNNWWRTIPNVTKKDNHFELYPNDIPCWSLAALLSIIPDVSLNAFKDTKWYAMIIHNGKMIYGDKDNPIDACVEMILKLKENNLI